MNKLRNKFNRGSSNSNNSFRGWNDDANNQDDEDNFIDKVAYKVRRMFDDDHYGEDNFSDNDNSNQNSYSTKRSKWNKDYYNKSDLEDSASSYDREQIDENFKPYAGRSYDRQESSSSRENHSGKGPKGYKRSDSRIEEDICDTMERSADLDAGDIEVQVSDREVTLSGSVSCRQSKNLAEDIADSISGVQDVDNKIKVKRSDLDRISS